MTPNYPEPGLPYICEEGVEPGILRKHGIDVIVEADGCVSVRWPDGQAICAEGPPDATKDLWVTHWQNSKSAPRAVVFPDEGWPFTSPDAVRDLRRTAEGRLSADVGGAGRTVPPEVAQDIRSLLHELERLRGEHLEPACVPNPELRPGGGTVVSEAYYQRTEQAIRDLDAITEVLDKADVPRVARVDTLHDARPQRLDLSLAQRVASLCEEVSTTREDHAHMLEEIGRARREAGNLAHEVQHLRADLAARGAALDEIFERLEIRRPVMTMVRQEVRS